MMDGYSGSLIRQGCTVGLLHKLLLWAHLLLLLSHVTLSERPFEQNPERKYDENQITDDFDSSNRRKVQVPNNRRDTDDNEEEEDEDFQNHRQAIRNSIKLGDYHLDHYGQITGVRGPSGGIHTRHHLRRKKNTQINNERKRYLHLKNLKEKIEDEERRLLEIKRRREDELHRKRQEEELQNAWSRFRHDLVQRLPSHLHNYLPASIYGGSIGSPYGLIYDTLTGYSGLGFASPNVYSSLQHIPQLAHFKLPYWLNPMAGTPQSIPPPPPLPPSMLGPGRYSSPGSSLSNKRDGGFGFGHNKWRSMPRQWSPDSNPMISANFMFSQKRPLRFPPKSPSMWSYLNRYSTIPMNGLRGQKTSEGKDRSDYSLPDFDDVDDYAEDYFTTGDATGRQSLSSAPSKKSTTSFAKSPFGKNSVITTYSGSVQSKKMPRQSNARNNANALRNTAQRKGTVVLRYSSKAG